MQNFYSSEMTSSLSVGNCADLFGKNFEAMDQDQIGLESCTHMIR